jgi:osmotically-inducible protein OsmY
MKLQPILLLLATVAFVAPLRAVVQQPDRAVTEAMANVYRLRSYTAFDWISARYLKGTLTLQGYARTPQLKQEATTAARKAAGIDDVINNIEVLPAHQGDDNIRVRAYAAIYGSSALEQYNRGGQFTTADREALLDSIRFGVDAADIARGPHAIHIIVNGARVLLLGQVRTSGDKQIAEAAVRSLSGILGVKSELRTPGQK